MTLVEVMVVVAIVGIAAAVAVPVFSGDSTESDFKGYVKRLVMDLQRARFEAMSSREDRCVFVRSNGYTLEAAVPNTVQTAAIKSLEPVPNRIELYGVLNQGAEPGTGYNPSLAILPAEIRFNALSQVELQRGGNVGTVAPQPSSATIFIRANDDEHKARIVVFETTAQIQVYWDW